MKTSNKILGILASCGVTMTELAALCGITRQTLNTYFAYEGDWKDLRQSQKVLETAMQIIKVGQTGALPLPSTVEKTDRLAEIKKLLAIQ
jgi:DNA-binding XRE family transcriptional regulator